MIKWLPILPQLGYSSTFLGYLYYAKYAKIDYSIGEIE